MATVYTNFASGTITDAPLLVGATTINSSAFADLPVVTAPDVMYITLDPDASAGAPEIVTVTAHTASATSVTVTRAAQSTTAREHAATTVWRHSFTATDADRIGVIEDDSVVTASIQDDAVTLAKIDDSDAGSSGNDIHWRKVGGQVFVEGRGVLGNQTLSAQLPVGFRPAVDVYFRMFDETLALDTASINTAGDIDLTQGSGIQTHTFHVSYPAA